MANVFVDTEKINRDMVPTLNTASQHVTNAGVAASKVNFPHGDFSWSSIQSNINNLSEKTNKSRDWMNRISRSMQNTINSGIEDVKSLEVNDVKDVTIIVK